MFKVSHEAPALSTFYNRKLSFTDNSFSWSNSLWRAKTAPQTISRIKETFTPAPLRVFRTLYSYFITKPQVFVSQEVLAAEAGVCRSTVRRFFKVAIDHDIVDIEHNFKQENGSYYSNRIRLNAHFLKHEILHMLKSLFINMRYGLFQLKSLISRKTALAANEPIEVLNVNLKEHNTLTDRVPTPRERLKKKKDIHLNKESINLIEANLDKLPLTTRGILRLGCYPVEVVQFIIKKGVNTQADDIFAYMIGTARKFNASEGRPPVDFSFADKAAVALNIHQQPYIDADRLAELKSQQREAPKSQNKSWTNQKQSAGSLGNPAPEWSAEGHRNWDDDQKRLEMQKYCDLYEMLGHNLPAAAKEKYDLFKKLLAAHPVPAGTVPGNQEKTREDIERLAKMAKKVSALGINPQGLAFWQMNEALRGNCFCCIVNRTNGDNPPCTKPNCFLIERSQPTAERKIAIGVSQTIKKAESERILEILRAEAASGRNPTELNADKDFIENQQKQQKIASKETSALKGFTELLSDNYTPTYVESESEIEELFMNTNLLFDM